MCGIKKRIRIGNCSKKKFGEELKTEQQEYSINIINIIFMKYGFFSVLKNSTIHLKQNGILFTMSEKK